jgi:NIMA (never in mitosis gene a)-related kinase
MEYCDGGDLANYLNIQMKTGRNLTEEKIWKFFIQISLGLLYIHNKKILHRDLKTLNIFLTKDDKVRIGDLGVAKVLSQTDFARTFVGTPYYLSPEICEEKPYNEKSDVWALGCILYEMATFKHPFNASNQGALILKILKGKYEPITNKEFSTDLKKMIDILLEKNYYKRPSMSEIVKHSSNI